MASRRSEGGEYQKINQVKLTCNLMMYNDNIGVVKKNMNIDINMMDPFTMVKIQLLEHLRSFGLNPDSLRWDIVFDQNFVDDEATPTDLGMVDGDTIGLQAEIPRNFSVSEDFRHELEKLFAVTKRTANNISDGLNVVVGEYEGGLPLPVAFSEPRAMEDERDIDQLLEFIEEEKKDQGKKKKRKKKIRKSGGAEAKDEVYDVTLMQRAPSVQKDVKSKNKSRRLGEIEILQEASDLGVQEKPEDLNTSDSKVLRETGTKKKKKPIEESNESIVTEHMSEEELLNKSIEAKMLLLKEKNDYAKNIIESKSKEMTKLIAGVEEIEDKNCKQLKEIGDVEARMKELDLCKARMVKECEERNETMSKLIKKKRKLEDFISTKLTETKEAIFKLEGEILDLQAKVLLPNPKPMAETQPLATEVFQQNQRLLEFINTKIEAKEKELECPVCFEVASAPIYMCDELHLICSSCRPKVIFKSALFSWPLNKSLHCRLSIVPSAESVTLPGPEDTGTRRRRWRRWRVW